MTQRLPIFGVCGAKGSGKSALIQQALPRLRRRGLTVAVVQSDAREAGPAPAALAEAARRADLVLAESREPAGLPCVWLAGGGAGGPPADAAPPLAVLGADAGRLAAFLELLEHWLAAQWRRTPVFGCVLIGGRSTRMGAPKHLLRSGRRTWIERTVRLLRDAAERVAIVGEGAVPDELAGEVRLSDAPDGRGPLAGLLAALRWAPHASWLVAACDLPHLSPDALDWLLATRAPGVWAALPRLSGSPGIEPLLAHYDFRALPLLEEVAAGGPPRPARIAGSPKVISPCPPPELVPAWTNVNTKSELASVLPRPGSAREDHRGDPQQR